jgi:hypothetical protein
MKRHKNNSKGLWAVIGALGLLSLLLSSCLKDTSTDTAPPVSLVTLIQASPDEPSLNFYVNGNRVNQNPINYGDDLDYFQVYSGNRQANFYGQSMNLLLSAPLPLAANTAYSLFMANLASKPEIVLLTDTLVKPAAGMASVRLVDVSPDAPPVDLAVQGGSLLVPNRTYKGYSSFAPIAAKTDYTFQIRQAGTSNVLATVSNVSLSAGSVYTIWFYGLAAATTNSDKLNAGLITNASFN